MDDTKYQAKKINKMKKTITKETELRELIPNPVGVPCRNEYSEELRKEHDRWKEEIDVNCCKDFSQLYHWEKVSICTVL